MRGISMSSNMTSGRRSCSMAMASIPSLATITSIPCRSSSREVTLRTVTESSTTMTQRRLRCTRHDPPGDGQPFALLSADQRQKIEDHDDAAVPEDRRPGHAADARELRT